MTEEIRKLLSLIDKLNEEQKWRIYAIIHGAAIIAGNERR